MRCRICPAIFLSRDSLNDHMNRIHKRKVYDCAICGRTFSRSDSLRRHSAIHNRKQLADLSIGHECALCGRNFTRRDNLSRHMLVHKKIQPSNPYPDEQQPSTSGIPCTPIGGVQRELNTLLSSTSTRRADDSCVWCGKHVQLIPGKKFCSECGRQGIECSDCKRPLPQRYYTANNSACDACRRKRDNQSGRGFKSMAALEGRVKTHTLEPTSANKLDILLFFKETESTLIDILNTELHTHNGLKWYLVISVRLSRSTSNGEEIYTTPNFRSYNSILINHNNNEIEQAIADAFHKMYESFQTFQREGSGWLMEEVVAMELNVAKYNPLSGSTYIPTPQVLVKKMALVNVQNSDEYCFIWSILAALHPANNNPQRLQHYTPYFESLNMGNLKFPLTLDQVHRFEAQNLISVNVFGYEDGVFPLHITSNRYNTHVNLLLISRGDIRHYCLIRSMSRLLGNRTKHDGQTFYCDYCLHGYSSEKLLDEHLPHCSPFGMQKTIMPEEKILKFKNIRNQMPIVFSIYADLEAYTVKIEDKTAKSTRYERHEPSSFCYTVVSSVTRYSKPAVVYRGPNVIETFLRRLQEENDYICGILNQIHPMIISPEQERDFQTASHCHICDKPLEADRVRDHCHVSGLYRGPAHNECNLQFRFKTITIEDARRFFIPVILHNCRGYDSHFLISMMGKFKHLKITCIPNNMQKYISFSLGNLRFIDSLQFLNSSLETLTFNMAKEGPDNFHQLKRHFPDSDKQRLLLRKGVFPYSHITDSGKFEETRLPPIDAFYNDLKETALSPEDYVHAQNVWDKFGIANLGEYQDLYIKTDVLLLADIFENFRKICLSYYKLDPLYYYTSPGLSWDAMLKMTRVELELLQDIDMHLLVERGIRGGISVIATKFAKANNPYLEQYNPHQPTSYITYLDANNLYGWAMSKYLPLKDFAWMSQRELETIDITSVSDDADVGYILECDLVYPDELHDLHNDYPLCPERMTVTDQLLSNYSEVLKNDLELKGKPEEKLIPNLYNKSKYVIHYSALKFCLSQGMILTKIHRGVSFVQSAWLKPYIDFNTEKRKLAKNDFEKDFFKLLNNSVFGKTMESVRRRVNIQLVHDNAKLEKLIAKPSFQSFNIFNSDICGVHMKKTKLVLNRPIYVGFTILDVSKILMYDFHYNHMKPKYGERLKLLFTDTDSLCYAVECKDIYEDMAENSNLFDTSNYRRNHPMFSQTNAKVLGKFKDETAGDPISEFVGLRSKMYSMIFSGEQKNTAKGVARYAVKKRLRHDTYKQSLFDRKQITTSMNCIRSYNHNLYSVNINKIGLSPFDVKRFVLDDGINTLAHGHYLAIFELYCE